MYFLIRCWSKVSTTKCGWRLGVYRGGLLGVMVVKLSSPCSELVEYWSDIGV